MEIFASQNLLICQFLSNFLTVQVSGHIETQLTEIHLAFAISSTNALISKYSILSLLDLNIKRQEFVLTHLKSSLKHHIYHAKIQNEWNQSAQLPEIILLKTTEVVKIENFPALIAEEQVQEQPLEAILLGFEMKNYSIQSKPQLKIHYITLPRQYFKFGKTTLNNEVEGVVMRPKTKNNQIILGLNTKNLGDSPSYTLFLFKKPCRNMLPLPLEQQENNKIEVFYEKYLEQLPIELQQKEHYSGIKDPKQQQKIQQGILSPEQYEKRFMKIDYEEVQLLNQGEFLILHRKPKGSA